MANISVKNNYTQTRGFQDFGKIKMPQTESWIYSPIKWILGTDVVPDLDPTV